MKELQVGDSVVFVDQMRKERAALVTHVWNQDYINLVVVSDDPKREDSCGRQIVHETSVSSAGPHNEAGRYFRRA